MPIAYVLNSLLKRRKKNSAVISERLLTVKTEIRYCLPSLRLAELIRYGSNSQGQISSYCVVTPKLFLSAVQAASLDH